MKKCFVVLTAVVLMFGHVGETHAIVNPLVEWDFESAGLGQISGIASSFQAGAVASAAFDTGNNGVEDFGGPIGKLSVTRFFSNSGSSFPFLDFSLSEPARFDSIMFDHYHNHNTGFPSNPQYDVDVEYSGDGGANWAPLGTFVASSTTFGDTVILPGPGNLGVGSHRVRWIGKNFAFGNDSNTEYFALNNVMIKSAIPEPITATLGLMGMGVLGLATRRRTA